MVGEATRERILRAFLALAAQRGMAAVTTRELARAAGVNEVTVFRHFGDTATLAREAVHHFQPAARIEAHRPAIDTSTAQRCLEGLVGCLELLESLLRERPDLVQFGLGDAVRYPEILEELRQVPDAARRMLTRAFGQAAEQLRPEVDVGAEVLGLLGLLFLLTVWRSRRWLELDAPQLRGLLTARLRPLLRDLPRGEQPLDAVGSGNAS
jgi:AcrR family transcriptional regulator